ncbi:MAG TPA: NAD(P)/FAD-dependent oxidoreductase [Rudaea sp.]|jgi:kynurenine 3-monooxygenase|nr:NAD(P)/FAD-dependent oxidoreductase [Rudaea sp.]
MKRDTTTRNTIAIVGAGLVGALLATLLAQRGFSVEIFERRPDPRKFGFIGGRSINLALAERGWHGLRVAGLQDRIGKIAVMMRGRMVHHSDGHTELLRYGRDDSEVIWSVSRAALNMALLDAAEAAGARVRFERPLHSVDWRTSTLHFGPENARTTHVANIVIGADGAGSALRDAMNSHIDLGERFEPLDHGYKELEIPPRDRKFAMEPNALHIWPRGNYMCIALPNSESSFTVTLFLPNRGNPSFETIITSDDAQALFARDFADALPLIPELQTDFAMNPTGMLGTLYLDRWHLDSRALLIGDAAHAIVPFHGQGMNCGFEDAFELAELMECDGDIESVFAEFEKRRKPNADAIAEMALENYVEMRDSVADAHFLLMRALERALAARHPTRFVPRYWMVTFSRVPYSVALERGDIQSAILRELTSGKTSIEQIDMARAGVLIEQRLAPFS